MRSLQIQLGGWGVGEESSEDGGPGEFGEEIDIPGNVYVVGEEEEEEG